MLNVNFRVKLSKKELEVEELQTELEARRSSSIKNSPSATVEGLKKELQAVIERNKSGKSHVMCHRFVVKLISQLSISIS